MKINFHNNLNRDLYFYRDKTGNEVDLIIEEASKIRAVEIKLSQTLAKDLFKGLDYYQTLASGSLLDSTLIYGGEEERLMYGSRVLPYCKLSHLF